MGERGYKQSHVVDVARLEQITGRALMSWAELARASGVALSTLVDVLCASWRRRCMWSRWSSSKNDRPMVPASDGRTAQE